MNENINNINIEKNTTSYSLDKFNESQIESNTSNTIQEANPNITNSSSNMPKTIEICIMLVFILVLVQFTIKQIKLFRIQLNNYKEIQKSVSNCTPSQLKKLKSKKIHFIFLSILNIILIAIILLLAYKVITLLFNIY